VLDLAGVAPPAQLNGTSWACLARTDPSGATCGRGGGAWRAQLDLEHSTIFNASNHWNALVTAEGLKYVFLATNGAEQLFNLTADPHEMENVAGAPAYAPSLAALRAALGAQWAAEGRGAGWVGADGLPVPRGPAGQVYSPNFPSAPPCPQPPTPVCGASWFSTTGGYYRSCGGAAGNLAPFSDLSVEAAQALCCANRKCAGLDFAVGKGGKGSGFLKTNALGGWTDSTAYVGFYKPGQVPGH
jgi:hypothetical protein